MRTDPAVQSHSNLMLTARHRNPMGCGVWDDFSAGCVGS